MDERRCYACRIRLDGAERFVVWYTTEDCDGFVRDDGRLLAWPSQTVLEAAIRPLGITLVGRETTDFDLDRLRNWCAAPAADGIDCVAFLNTWNFFDDLAGLHDGADTPYVRLSREAAECYDKLFRGNNIPAMTPPGEHYAPTWDTDEPDAIARVLRAGIELMRAELSLVPDPRSE